MSRQVIVITGPTGAGKSTIGELVAKRLPRSINIDADNIKHMIVSGFYIDEKNPEDPNGWGFNQWELVGENIGLLAKNFLAHNYDVVINGYIDEPAWIAIEQKITINHKILLLPQVDVVVGRDAGRAIDVQMGANTAMNHHNYFSSDKYFKDFETIDTSSQTTEETVTKVMRIIGESDDRS